MCCADNHIRVMLELANRPTLLIRCVSLDGGRVHTLRRVDVVDRSIGSDGPYFRGTRGEIPRTVALNDVVLDEQMGLSTVDANVVIAFGLVDAG